MTSLFPLSRLFLRYRNNKLAIVAENWEVYTGVVSLANLPKPYRVKRILLNERYDSKTNDYDVALLKLVAPVVFNGQSELSCSQNSTPVQVPVFQNPKSPNRSSYVTFR